MKPLFIPLKAKYFEAFENGTKDTEYRRYGPRWNEGTCQPRRPVTLSLGYSGRRLQGYITHFEARQMDSEDWINCYGEPGLAACIGIQVNGESQR